MTPGACRHWLAVSIVAILLWGCSDATPAEPSMRAGVSATPASSVASAPPPSPGVTAPTEEPGATAPSDEPSAAPSATATPSPEPTGDGGIDVVGDLDSLLGVTVVTVIDRIRVRSAPNVSEESTKYEPLLPLGTSMYVFGGPVRASGYEWYAVAMISVGLTAPGWCGSGPCDRNYTGWAARAGRNGEPWLEPGNPVCPPLPTRPLAVATLPHGARLACFSGVPITIEARLIECNCDVDGGGYQPSWFGVDDQPLLLVDPAETRPADYRDWLIVALDPAGRHPNVLPVGEVVDVTGMFDHPAAENCLYQDIPIELGPPMPSPGCRFIFATTSMVPAE